MFIYSLRTPPTKTPPTAHYQQISVESNETNVKASVIHREKELIIFSKSRYLNQTHKVALISLLSFHFCRSSLVRMSSVT